METPRGGLLTAGIVGALWSASNGINAFIKSSNEAYEIAVIAYFSRSQFTFTLQLDYWFCWYCYLTSLVFRDVILASRLASITGY